MGVAERILTVTVAAIIAFFFEFLSAMHEVRRYHNLYKGCENLKVFNSAKRWKQRRNDYVMVAGFNLIMAAGFSWFLYHFLKDVL